MLWLNTYLELHNEQIRNRNNVLRFLILINLMKLSSCPGLFFSGRKITFDLI